MNTTIDKYFYEIRTIWRGEEQKKIMFEEKKICFNSHTRDNSSFVVAYNTLTSLLIITQLKVICR